MDELEVELDTAAREMAAEALALAKSAKETKSAKATLKETPAPKNAKAEELAKKHVVAKEVVEEVEEDDEMDEELLSNVFKSLAGDKTYVAPKDLLNWDIVLELMGEVSSSRQCASSVCSRPLVLMLLMLIPPYPPILCLPPCAYVSISLPVQ